MAVLDVARAADVSEQTVYNYFPTKERLVLDRDEEFEAKLAELVRRRPPGCSPAKALRGEALTVLDRIASIPPEELLAVWPTSRPSARRCDACAWR